MCFHPLCLWLVVRTSHVVDHIVIAGHAVWSARGDVVFTPVYCVWLVVDHISIVGPCTVVDPGW